MNKAVEKKQMYETIIKCQFGSKRCLCQWCEKQCNNGLECHECDMEQKPIHDCYMCTGFDGTFPSRTHSEEMHNKAIERLKKRLQ